MSAERQRKYRQRRREGVMLITVPTDSETRSALVEKGLVPEWDEENPDAIGTALLQLAGRVTRNAPAE
jgi:hypothetical protein